MREATVWTFRGFAFWAMSLMVLALLVFSAPVPASAQQSLLASQSCAVPVNSCGCSTCGCDGGSSQPSCPSGQVLYDDYCLPACPGSFVRYPGLPGFCMPPCDNGCPVGYDEVPVPNCPDGFYRDLQNPDLCVQDQGRAKYGDNCPQGMTYSSAVGQCEVNCPAGSYVGETGLCTSYYQKDCEDGFQRNPETGQCLPPGYWPTSHKWICLPTCPTGYQRDFWKPTRCLPPPETCKDGYEDYKGRCLPECEQGAKRDTYGYCTPPNQCEDGSFTNLRGKCSPPECPQGYDNIRGTCYKPCEEGYRRDAQVAERCIPVDKECPDGQRLNENTNQCERIPPPPVKCKPNTTYSQKTKRCEPDRQRQPDCEKGFVKDNNGRCVPVRQPKLCEPSFVKDNNGRCVPIRKRPVCEDGERLNGNGVCEPIQRLLVPQGCRDGFYYSAKRKKCLRIQVEEDIPDEPPPQREEQSEPDQPALDLPGILLNPDVLQRLKPRDDGCGPGLRKDNNGRCVKVQ
jgi:hypothetical protein